MAASDPAARAAIARLGARTSWARTVDRSARTANARRNGPGQLDWHLKRLGPEFDGASERDRHAAAEAARKAWFARLAASGRAARARQGGRS